MVFKKRYARGKNPNSWTNGFKKGHIGYNNKPNSGSFKLGQTSPNKGKRGQVPWNKDLTKETSSILLKLSISVRGDKNINYGKPAWNKNLKGYFAKEKHWNWKGGKSTLNHSLRSSSKWKIWRESVFLRDNFTCQNPNCEFCHNKIGVMLHPHHIKPLSLFPKLTFDIDNGITYCAEYHIHGKLHIGIQRKKKTQLNKQEDNGKCIHNQTD